MGQADNTDRYVSFCGIECDSWADELYNKLQTILNSDANEQWQRYFSMKLEEQARMKHDNLFFVGAQMNNLYSLFEELGDQDALQLLWKLEQECC